eukprot:TRINITY_DN5078_c0_g1_i1.p1 TRINITY_DN5078_c0_g1~~TRINITY_DN5078_c0_g1_i1.p1  ORF type:complete len:329 (+),score=24.48 TRINITY_DN5078_c0_g1_i1:42-1028(+)
MAQSKLASTQLKIWRTLEFLNSHDPLTRYVKYSLDFLIFINIIVIMLETVNEIYFSFVIFFDLFEYILIIIFATEYLLRLWACTQDEFQKYTHPIFGRIKWMIHPYSIIDLISILPSIVSVGYTMVTGEKETSDTVRAIRMVRLVRALVLLRRAAAVKLLISALKSKQKELGIVLILLIAMLAFCSSVMYVLEGEAQPEKFGSIFEASWFGISTLTAIAYGDVYPVTPLGKIAGGVFCLMGLGWFALPAGLLAIGFTAAFEKRLETKGRCVVCGSKKGKRKYSVIAGLGRNKMDLGLLETLELERKSIEAQQQKIARKRRKNSHHTGI